MENSSTVSPATPQVRDQRPQPASHAVQELPVIPRRPNRDSAPLSFAQRQMWVLDQITPGNPAYNTPHGFCLLGPLKPQSLEDCFNEIIKRHEVLRTTFAVKDGEPIQRIHPELKIRVEVTPLDHLGAVDREARLHKLVSAEAIKPFDLSRLPLIRARLFKLHETEHILFLNIHHIVADGWSLGLLFNELSTLYDAATGGGERRLPDPPLQYADFANWQRQCPTDQNQINYWKKQLGGPLPVLELPTDKPRPARKSVAGSNVFFNIQAPLAKQLKSLGARHGCTPYMTLLAAFEVLLHRYSSTTDIVVGTPFASRGRPELQPMIGNFINMAALRCDLSGNPTFEELLGRTRATLLDAHSNGSLPFETMIEHLKFERDSSRDPVFQVLFQFLPGRARRIGNLDVSSFHFDQRFTQFDLSLHVYGTAQGFLGRMEYCTDLFEEPTIRRMCEHFDVLLQSIVHAPEKSIAELPMLTDQERQTVLCEWNSNEVADPANMRCLHQLFEEQVNRSPAKVAVKFEGQALTYNELNRRANRLAHRLKRMGIGPDASVALLLGRSTTLLVGMLGILKAGGAYVPMDPEYPRKRIESILEDSNASVVVTEESLAEHLRGFGGQRICLDRDQADLEREPAENPNAPVAPDQLAYVLFTSGSTGRPKGVALEHRSAAMFVEWARRTFTPAELAGVLFSTSVCFDLSVFEIFVTLSAGGTIILAGNALHLPTLPEKDEVTLINTVPSAIAELVRMRAVPASVKTINLAGEALAEDLVEQIYANTNCERVYNLYGPTEATTYSTFTLVERGRPVTIGRPVAGTQCYVLDSHRQPVPIGVPGELYIAGAGLARGYHGRADLTGERFVPNPFSGEPGARMYRTGDLCRWLPDGKLKYLGRTDHQVKLRGFRIELGEIEKIIASHPAVHEVVVVAREDTPGDKRLVAYFVAENPPADLVDQLRAHVRSTLPEYMLPARFVALDKLPRTPNGKVDRKTLPLPSEGEGTPGSVAVAPRTPTEELVVNAFRDVLGGGGFGLQDNFFDLGGNSLMAARMIWQLRNQSGLDLPLRILFDRQTAGDLAAAIDALTWAADSRQQSAPTGNRVEVEL